MSRSTDCPSSSVPATTHSTVKGDRANFSAVPGVTDSMRAFVGAATSANGTSARTTLAPSDFGESTAYRHSAATTDMAA